MTYNLPLLRKERDWVAEQISLPYSESELEMDYWIVDTPGLLDDLGKTCGTSYCVAGHIAATTPGVEWHGINVTINGQYVDVASWARKQLGIDYDEATELFYSGNDDVIDVLDELIAKAEAEEQADAA